MTQEQNRLNILLSLKDEASKELRSTSAKIRAEQRRMVNAELSGDKATQKSARANIKLLKIEQSETKELARDIKSQVREQEKSVQATKKQSSAFGGLRSSMLAIGAGIAVIGGVTAGITKFVTSVANAGDEIQKMSLRTGFTTEALSELRFAAKLSGTSIQGMETGFRRMASTIVDAESGLAESKRAFDQLGISAGALQGIGIEQQFAVISTALADVEDQTLKVALAQDIFGRAGTQLLPMLAQGSEGLAKMRKEANELGIVFDQEAANKAAEFNDQLLRLSSSMEGVKKEIGLALIDPLTEFSEEGLNAINTLKLLTAQLERDIESVPGVDPGFGLRDIQGDVIDIVFGLKLLKLAFDPLVERAKQTETELKATADAIASVTLAINRGNVDLYGRQVKETGDAVRNYTKDIQALTVGLKESLNAETEFYDTGNENSLKRVRAVQAERDEEARIREQQHKDGTKVLEQQRSEDKKAIKEQERHERDSAKVTKAALEEAAKIHQEGIDKLTKLDIARGQFEADQFALSQRLFEESERDKTRIAEREARARTAVIRREFERQLAIATGGFSAGQIAAGAGLGPPGTGGGGGTGFLFSKTAEDRADDAFNERTFRKFNPTPQNITVNFNVNDQTIQTMKVEIERSQLDELDEV